MSPDLISTALGATVRTWQCCRNRSIARLPKLRCRSRSLFFAMTEPSLARRPPLPPTRRRRDNAAGPLWPDPRCAMQTRRLKLQGFNNLTKTLSFNIYDVNYALSERHQREYIEYIDR